MAFRRIGSQLGQAMRGNRRAFIRPGICRNVLPNLRRREKHDVLEARLQLFHHLLAVGARLHDHRIAIEIGRRQHVLLDPAAGFS